MGGTAASAGGPKTLKLKFKKKLPGAGQQQQPPPQQ
jgi:hypothetical protein